MAYNKNPDNNNTPPFLKNQVRVCLIDVSQGEPPW